MSYYRVKEKHQRRSRGVVVITTALLAEGPQFDPGRDHVEFCFKMLMIYSIYVIIEKVILATHCFWRFEILQ